MTEKKQKQPIQVEISKELKPTYSNFVIIHHNYNEIVLDFAHLLPNLPQAQVQERVVMTPYHAKLLLQAITHNLQNYEKRFGEIKMRSSDMPERLPMGSNSTQVH